MMSHPVLARRQSSRRGRIAGASGAGRLWLATALTLLLAAPAAGVGAQTLAADEVALMTALDDARAGRARAALEGLGALVERNPNFRLAQLVYADLLLARAGRFAGFGTVDGASEARLADLRAEALARLSHRQSPPSDQLAPAALLSLAPSQRHVVLVDQKQSRLYVFENANGRPRLVGDYYVSTGKKGARKEREGDQRTPVGVYFITTRLDAEVLDDFYGAGALPMNYPNEWDDRYGRTGYGIWIHGVPSDTYSRPPRASDGCIALPNGDLASLLGSLDVGTTPVVLADGVDWIAAGAVADRGNDLRRAIETWRRDWESGDAPRYAGHYAADFTGEGINRAAWVDRERLVGGATRSVRVTIDDLSLYAYPGEQDLVVASFEQSYDSDAVSERSSRRQYWRRDADGRWRIVYEGAASFRPEHFRGIPWSARSQLVQLLR